MLLTTEQLKCTRVGHKQHLCCNLSLACSGPAHLEDDLGHLLVVANGAAVKEVVPHLQDVLFRQQVVLYTVGSRPLFADIKQQVEGPTLGHVTASAEGRQVVLQPGQGVSNILLALLTRLAESKMLGGTRAFLGDRCGSDAAQQHALLRLKPDAHMSG